MKLYIWENVECLADGLAICVANSKDEAIHLISQRFARGRLDNEEFSDWQDMEFSTAMYEDIASELRNLIPYREEISETAYLFSGNMNKIFLVLDLTNNPQQAIISAIQQYDVKCLYVHKSNVEMVADIVDLEVKEMGGILKNELFMEVEKDPR